MTVTTFDSIPPAVPMAMLTSLPLRREHWIEIARRASWQSTRMNLNTFERHGVFEDAETVEIIARRLRDREQIARSRVLPYQLLVAFRNARTAPPAIVRALEDALELATRNVPAVAGKVWIFPDVSGSMHAPVTGHRKGSTTTVRCVDVAALVSACLLRINPDAGVLPFSSDVVSVRLNPRDTVMTNAEKLASLPSGGTACSAPLRWLNDRRERGDLLLYVSDNESWLDGRGAGVTATMNEWCEFKRRNPRARLACLDLQPYGHSQIVDREDVLNVGGFSDSVFELIARFADRSIDAAQWTRIIEEITI